MKMFRRLMRFRKQMKLLWYDDFDSKIGWLPILIGSLSIVLLPTNMYYSAFVAMEIMGLASDRHRVFLNIVSKYKLGESNRFSYTYLALGNYVFITVLLIIILAILPFIASLMHINLPTFAGRGILLETSRLTIYLSIYFYLLTQADEKGLRWKKWTLLVLFCVFYVPIYLFVPNGGILEYREVLTWLWKWQYANLFLICMVVLAAFFLVFSIWSNYKRYCLLAQKIAENEMRSGYEALQTHETQLDQGKQDIVN